MLTKSITLTQTALLSLVKKKFEKTKPTLSQIKLAQLVTNLT